MPRNDSANVTEIGPAPTIETATEVKFGQFARECQIHHLVTRIVRHVFDPASDETFQQKEAAQLEKTMLHFLPLLENIDLSFGVYCASLATCARYHSTKAR